MIFTVDRLRARSRTFVARWTARTWWSAALAVAVAVSAHAADDPAGPSRLLAERTCATLAARVDEVPGAHPVFLRSYDDASGQGPLPLPALANAAFTYDNALAAIALTACGRREQAVRIGEALLLAVRFDRAGERSRLRNTYRAGAQTERPVPPMGWWDAGSNRWLEDAYHVGSATGNVAWAALALLTISEATGQGRFRDGAARLGSWAIEHARDRRGLGGFTGGVHGYDDAPQPLRWKSTEHNTDLVAVFDWLARTEARIGASDSARTDRRSDWSEHAQTARRFLDSMWDGAAGRFLIGTLPDGATPNRASSSLDAQLWPLLLRDAPRHWRRALDYAERAHRVNGGFDFNDDRDGVWVEGTAQAALAYQAVGRASDAQRLQREIAAEISRGGLVWATRGARITTGLAIGPSSSSDDFHYYRRPHVGATAWAALAALGWNPFVGRRLP